MLTHSNTCLPWPTLPLLRLALLPMTMVNAMCALSATHWQPYAFTSAAMVLRFAMLVQVGALGVEAATGHFNRCTGLAQWYPATTDDDTVTELTLRRFRQSANRRSSSASLDDD